MQRRSVLRFQFVVLNRPNTENVRENSREFELEPPPYLLYRSSTEVNGIWFFQQEMRRHVRPVRFHHERARQGGPAAAAAHGGGSDGGYEPRPAAQPAQPQPTGSVEAFSRAAGQSRRERGARADSRTPAMPAPAPTMADEPKQKREKKKEKPPAVVESGRDSPAVGAGGGGLNREVVRAAMYKLVANDNFIDLMVISARCEGRLAI